MLALELANDALFLSLVNWNSLAGGGKVEDMVERNVVMRGGWADDVVDSVARISLVLIKDVLPRVGWFDIVVTHYHS